MVDRLDEHGLLLGEAAVGTVVVRGGSDSGRGLNHLVENLHVHGRCREAGLAALVVVAATPGAAVGKVKLGAVGLAHTKAEQQKPVAYRSVVEVCIARR